MINPRPFPATTWLLQGCYVVAEVVIGLNVTGYSFVDDTISDLGATTSPGHAAMNVVFVVFGVSLGLGAWLLRDSRPPGRLATASLVLWIVAGISSVAVGLTPNNLHPGLHGGVAAWVFVAQPLALVLLGLSLRERHRRFAAATVAVGVASFVGSLGFLVLLNADHGAGAFERLALWPGYLWVTVLAWSAWSAWTVEPQD
ncbi:DUF998 domain-containing protein [Nocardioides sp. WS12]|uniref:DUF998 domain-containing protein n=1 Tax=Nocardioides sp. WS12 TaxID=2486272 RepID=UPI0015F875EA|nr:DUF998 domain-containing protein [Nocardioides sp. WS12]